MAGVAAPDVTVVVPVYDALPYLRDCLDSLVQQTLGPDRLQVVAVDDGSTDGSGAVLDEYVERHPGVVEVVHQANSGGPARPCNVGLARARGRYVFFLGADDRLGVEALARMVEAADRWGSDVLCAKVVGAEGRMVLQDLFAADVEDVPFPSRLLSHALANIKLFRRSVLEEHGIDYPLDLRIGSDQPFTIAAMRHARKISVLADYDYYVAVRREDSSNLSYSTGWRTRLGCITAVMGWVAEQFGPGADRDTILHRHFHSELAKLLRRDFPEIDAEEQRELADGIGELVATYLTPAIAEQLPVVSRVRFRLAAAGRVDDLRVLEDAETRSWPLVLDDPLRRRLPGYGADPESWFTVSEEQAHRLLARAVGPASVTELDGRVRLEAECHLEPVREAQVRLALVRSPTGVSRAARQTSDGFRPKRAVDVRIERGLLTAEVDPSTLRDAPPAPYALRLAVELGQATFTIPLTLADARDPRTRHHDPATLVARPDPHGRALVELAAWQQAREETN